MHNAIPIFNNDLITIISYLIIAGNIMCQYVHIRAKTGTEFWNRLSDLWKPNRNRLIVILSLIVGRSKLVKRTSEDDLSLPLMGWDPTISSVW